MQLKKGGKGTGKRNKPAKPVFPVPAEKFRTHETPGFDVRVHAKLKPTDFHDPLHHAMWDVWYFEQRAKHAQEDVDALAALGSNAEERTQAKEELRWLKAFENLAAKRQSAGNTAALSRLTDRLGSLFQKMSAPQPATGGEAQPQS